MVQNQQNKPLKIQLMVQLVKLTNQITMRMQMTLDLKLKLLLTRIIQILEVEEDFKQIKTQELILDQILDQTLVQTQAQIQTQTQVLTLIEMLLLNLLSPNLAMMLWIRPVKSSIYLALHQTLEVSCTKIIVIQPLMKILERFSPPGSLYKRDKNITSKLLTFSKEHHILLLVWKLNQHQVQLQIILKPNPNASL